MIVLIYVYVIGQLMWIRCGYGRVDILHVRRASVGINIYASYILGLM